MNRMSQLGVAVALAFLGSEPLRAQAAQVQSPSAAIAQDALTIADRVGLPATDAARSLRLQEASVAVTDAIAERFAGRLAGITVELAPAFRLVVLLKGDAPVANEQLQLGGELVPVNFRTGAGATRTEIVQAIANHQAAIRDSLLSPPAMGVDQRTGELVVVVKRADIAREGAEPLRQRLAALAEVPVRLRVVDEPGLDFGGIEGGMRVVGSRPDDPHRYICTGGFVVSDGARTGIATAAHCADELSFRDGEGREVQLPFAGQWGWGYQDVQVNLSPEPLTPYFRPDTLKTISRPVTAARARGGMRAGDVVCHRGERTGYSCSQVELTDFAPAGDLCGGACLPTWTTVTGPSCKSGDSGGPVFLGTTAYGIVKGGSYRADGSCAFYFYMSTDYLPEGWRLMMAGEPVVAPLPLDGDGQAVDEARDLRIVERESEQVVQQ